MIDLKPLVDRIEALLREGTQASVTYAALEARLALEKVCYDRLRQRHDYISNDDLRRWPPRGIMETLIQEVDEHAAEGMSLSIGKSPARDGVDPADEEYIHLGTEVGFDPKKIGKLWQALSNLALHVRLPKDKHDQIPEYGDRDLTESKVREVLEELRRLAKGTMTFSGFGVTVSFQCECGSKNDRRASLLRPGQRIHCINSQCDWTYIVRETDGEFTFETEWVDSNCARCDRVHRFPLRMLTRLRFGDSAQYECRGCGHWNKMRLQFMQAVLQREPENRESDI